MGIDAAVSKHYIAAIRSFAVSVGTTVYQNNQLHSDFGSIYDDQGAILDAGRTYPWFSDPFNYIEAHLSSFVVK